MSQTEIQILEMLKQGHSYSQIQESLQVSSKTIAATKKAHFLLQESKTVLSHGNKQLIPDPLSSQNKAIINSNKNQKSMATNDDYQENTTNFESKVFNESRDGMKRELDMLEMELQLKRNEIESIKKTESERKSLIRQTKKIIQSCQDKDYTYEEIEILLSEVTILVNSCEKYCTDSEIEVEDSECITILKKVEGNLAEFLCSFEPDEDDEMELTFDYAFRDLQKWTTFKYI